MVWDATMVDTYHWYQIGRFISDRLFIINMAQYNREAIASSLTGSITCGSRCGYEGSKEFTLEETLDILDGINRNIGDTGLQPIPYIVREGVLVGRASTDIYREKVFTMDFSWSPRAPEMERNTFYETLIEYANILGTRMEQERVYVEFDGKTEVLKKAD